MSNENAVLSAQYGFNIQQQQPTTVNVGYFEPDVLQELNKHGRLYLIADSMPGTTVSPVAGQYAIQKILHDFYRQYSDLPPEDRLSEVLQKTNQAILKQNESLPGRRKLGTALIIALIMEQKLLVANSGDNEAFVVWENSLEHLSRPKLLPAPSEESEPTKLFDDLPPSDIPAQGLGLSEDTGVINYQRRLFPGDTAVLMSGGLTGFVTHKEIAEHVTRFPPKAACEKLIALAQTRGCRDTVGISITKILDKPANQAPPKRAILPKAPNWDSVLRLPLPRTREHTSSHRPQPTEKPPVVAPTYDEPQSNRRWQWIGATILMFVFIAGLVFFNLQYFSTTIEAETASSEEQTESTAGATIDIAEANDTSNTAESSTASEQPTATFPPTLPPATVILPSPTAVEAEPIVSPLSTPIASPTSSGSLGEDIAALVQATPTRTATPRPTVPLPPDCLNGGRYYRDLTVPDGSILQPDQPFEKSWELQNAGDCPWVPGYTVRYVSGDTLHTETRYEIPFIQPEEFAEVTAPMVAPSTPGRYRSQWQLYNLDDEPFGAELYVDIIVATPEPGVVAVDADETVLYDFVVQADDAIWSAFDALYAVRANRIDDALEIVAPDGIVVRGIAALRGGRDTPNDVLLTHPHQDFGFIEGLYTVDTPLEPTDSLVLVIGFPQVAILNSDGATFEILFTPNNGTEQIVLFSQQLGYRDGPYGERIALDMLDSGASGIFTLRIRSGDDPVYDWALWQELQLVR